MPDDWYYTQGNERQGPASSAKLKELATEGWLTPDDLVWQNGMADWVPAGKVRELFGSPLVQTLRGAVEVAANGGGSGKPRGKRASSTGPTAGTPAEVPSSPGVLSLVDWSDLSPRHLLALAGGFIAALGIAFTTIAQSPLALAFTLGGLVLGIVGLNVEVSLIVGQAVQNIGMAYREMANQRQEARKIALETKKLDLEAKRLAHEQAVLHQQALPPPPAPPAGAQVPRPPELPQQAPGGNTVVINHPPVQKWSLGLAAVLSFFVPGLGQLYKGQLLNGLIWFFMVGFGYVALILPGLVLHFFCVLGALSGNPWTEGRTTVVRQ